MLRWNNCYLQSSIQQSDIKRYVRKSGEVAPHDGTTYPKISPIENKLYELEFLQREILKVQILKSILISYDEF